MNQADAESEPYQPESKAKSSPGGATAWQTSTGTHNQLRFQVSHPPDWDLYVLPTTANVVSRRDPNALVSFMWFHGLGTMDSNTLLANTMQYNDVRDYRIIESQPLRVISLPAGPLYVLEQDAEFTYRGERCQAHLTSQVTDSNPPYEPFWSGSIIWKQAPLDRWLQYKYVVDQISSSFRVVPAAASPTPVIASPTPATQKMTSVNGGGDEERIKRQHG